MKSSTQQKKVLSNEDSAKHETRKKIIACFFDEQNLFASKQDTQIVRELLVEDKKFKEVASSHNLPVSFIKYAYERAITHLKSRLEVLVQQAERSKHLEKELFSLHNELANYKEKESKEKQRLELPIETRNLLAKSVNECGFSARLKNILENSRIDKVSDLVKLNGIEFLRLRNTGRNTIGEIETYFQENGLRWRMDI